MKKITKTIFFNNIGLTCNFAELIKNKNNNHNKSAIPPHKEAIAERIYVVGLSTRHIIAIRSPDARSIGAFTVDWDQNGNIAANDAGNDITYTFNWDNKLRKAEWPTDTSSIEIKYDPLGNRVYKKSTAQGSAIEHKYIVAPPRGR